MLIKMIEDPKKFNSHFISVCDVLEVISDKIL